MERNAQSQLIQWLKKESRKPLVIRGARQVGKTWLVRHVVKEAGYELIELNFEKDPTFQGYFSTNDPRQTILALEIFRKRKITLEKTVLFLDEIQSFPEVLAKLRWFYEEMPQLPVIAAGSLLDFVLGDHQFSMPVGRISYFHLEPITFEEFLAIQGDEVALEFLHNLSLEEIIKGNCIPLPIHKKLLESFKLYSLIGGMPDAIKAWLNTKSFISVAEIHRELLATYRDDFAKYSKRLPTERLDEVMLSIPRMLGEKFKYSHVNQETRTSQIKEALNLLCKARIAHKTQACSANGIPLGATINPKIFKVIFLDCGLSAAMLGLILDDNIILNDLTLVNKGAFAEQIVGQILRTLEPNFIEPSLFYWINEKRGSEAEIDYLLQSGRYLVPIEVKAGKTGSLKSLHSFMHLKKLKIAVRINNDFPSMVEVNIKSQKGFPVNYHLLSLPFYLCWKIKKLVLELQDRLP